MNIGNVNLDVHQDLNGWDFKVDYTLNFAQTEVDSDFVFEHAVVLWESDKGEPFGGDDDKLWTLLGQFINPDSTTESISRSFSNSSSGSLDTESGGEEIWAEVYARNSTTAGQVTSRRSAEININP
jgi:hypothetical protein